jgi:hypothetical protein
MKSGQLTLRQSAQLMSQHIGTQKSILLRKEPYWGESPKSCGVPLCLREAQIADQTTAK